MTVETDQAGGLRVLVLPPTAKDAELVRTMLGGAGVACVICRDLREVCDELAEGAAAVLFPEEAVVAQSHDGLTRFLRDQPPWSDMPVLILARPGADSASAARAMDLLGNVTVLERPMRVAALVSAVRSALRARGRQYQIREHLVERERSEEALRSADRRGTSSSSRTNCATRSRPYAIRSSSCSDRGGTIPRRAASAK